VVFRNKNGMVNMSFDEVIKNTWTWIILIAVVVVVCIGQPLLSGLFK
jgi:hypothetical protein